MTGVHYAAISAFNIIIIMIEKRQCTAQKPNSLHRRSCLTWRQSWGGMLQAWEDVWNKYVGLKPGVTD